MARIRQQFGGYVCQNNFTKAIADYKQAFRAIQMFKDEYVLQDYQRPMGVATYRTSQEQLRELLPDEEEMKRLMGKNEDNNPSDDSTQN